MKKHFLIAIISSYFLFHTGYNQAQDGLSEPQESFYSHPAHQLRDSLKVNQKTASKERLKSLHLRRFFMDYALFGYSELSPDQNNIMRLSEQFAGPQIRIGSSWYLVRGNFRGILRLTWLRAGIAIGDGLVLASAPLNIGLGHNFRVSENFSIELMVSGGPVIIGPGFLDDYIQLTYGIAPELKFNIGNIVLGMEYSYKKIRNNYDLWNNSSNGSTHYYSLGIGFRF